MAADGDHQTVAKADDIVMDYSLLEPDDDDNEEMDTPMKEDSELTAARASPQTMTLRTTIPENMVPSSTSSVQILEAQL